MDLDVVDTASGKKGSVKLPLQFEEQVRPDLIRKAYQYYASHKRQPWGADPEAGKRSSATVSRRRRQYRGAYGIGISRVPRKVLSRRGRRMNWVGAFAPGTVGGRRAHPPKSWKVIALSMNIKERRKSIRSALAATVTTDEVGKKHRLPKNYPVVLDASFEALSRTSEVEQCLVKLGLQDELTRASKRKIRAGKGKMRGRRYQNTAGPLLVVRGDCALRHAAANIPGVEVVEVSELNVLHLAPGAEPGRMAFFTKPALELMVEKGLFLSQRH
ncbi:50S ribosomal protein L4 [Candidatus Woesearchaeota archaeon]|nr:50S ribosomal protein L4 [Candidatus Woesearchaeota archaeon]